MIISSRLKPDFSNRLLLLILLIFSFTVSTVNAGLPPDSSEYFNPSEPGYTNRTYNSEIKSILLFKAGFELSDPIIQLNTEDKLQLEFDDLGGNIREYYYSFTHCNAEWAPTEIWQNEYLEGTLEDRIDDYSFSFNTRQPYTHYQAVFPNQRFTFKISGNYVLKVYTKSPDGDEIIAFTRRMMVFDPKVSVAATLQRATTLDETDTHQEIDFSISTSGYRIDAPYQDVQVTIMQNGRWDNALTKLKPFMVRGELLDYAYDNGSNEMKGGNEFRHFDFKSLKYLSDRVKEIRYSENMYHVYLWESERRTFKVYSQDDDIDGKFLLHTEDEKDVATMGEYATVHFFLPYQAPVVNGALYVAGGFNSWEYTPENRMKYNFNKHGYEAEILLKQGYYNFQYVLLEDNSKAGDESYIEGSHFETENNYTILVYHHDRGSLYDQLIYAGSYQSNRK